MSTYEICIDLGSDYTTIYKKNTGVVLREPTLALVQSGIKGLKILKVGLQAQKYIGKTSNSEIFVRPVLQGVIKNVELTKKILNIFLTKVIEYKVVKPTIKLIVLLPVSLSKEEYEDYKKVFYGIGFAKIDFVYNVVSCSLVDTPYFSNGKATMLVNIGAGKTELATVVNGKIINAYSLNVGGNLLDDSIIEHIEETKDCIISHKTATKIKEEIGSLYETDKSSIEVFVQDKNINNQITKIIYAKDILKPIYENYFKILQTIQAFFNECKSETAEDIRNEGIVLYGGASQIAGLEKFFKSILNLSVFVLDNPEIIALSGCEKLFSDNSFLQKIVDEN